MTTRAEALADRIEQGARELATFAKGLSDGEWRTRAADGRTIGVVVHHVASVYPVEMQLAKAIAAGGSVEGVTWGVVNRMNDEHAASFAGGRRRTR